MDGTIKDFMGQHRSVASDRNDLELHVLFIFAARQGGSGRNTARMGRADVDGDVSHFSGKRLLQSRVNAYVLASITSSQSAHPALNTSILLFFHVGTPWHLCARRSQRP